MNRILFKGTWDRLSSLCDGGSYLHYSFDFWNTLAFSNPVFKEKRAILLCQFLQRKFSISEINEAFEAVGRKYNRLMESRVKTSSPNALYELVIKKLGFDCKVDLSAFILEVNRIFLLHPPILCDSFLIFFESVVVKPVTVSITSNTAFISGAIIKQFLANCSLLYRFDFCLFSDEVGFGKPAKEMFRELFFNTNKLNPGLKEIDVMHIGDNVITDFEGPKKFGFSSFLLTPKQVLNNSRYSVHSITKKGEFPFSSIAYSKFKFGDYSIAKKFAIELFDYFVSNEVLKLDKFSKKIIVYSSPYSKVPTSSYYLVEEFFKLMDANLCLGSGGKPDLKFGKINRCQTYTQDYGAMDAQQRYDLIKNDTYSFDTIPDEDSVCIFIDDISITGSHQLVVENMLSTTKCFNTSIFLYYAKLDNLVIPPSVENDLNFSYVKSIENLLNVVLGSSFRFTTRLIKNILSRNTNEFEFFFKALQIHERVDLIYELYSLALANEYDSIEAYKNNIFLINRIIENHKEK